MIQYHVRVERGNGPEPQFKMRDPRRLHAGDTIEWQGHAYKVLSASFDPTRPHLAVITVARANILA
jgi:hypothetical protein